MVLSLGLIAISLWALLLPPLFPISDRAMVNAPSVTLSASGAGIAKEVPPVLAMISAESGPLVVIERELPELEAQLTDARLSKVRITEQISNLEALRDNAIAEEARLAREFDTTRQHLLEAVQGGLRASEARLALATASLGEATAKRKRLSTLLGDGIITEAQFSEAKTSEMEALREVQRIEAARTDQRSEMRNLESASLAVTHPRLEGVASRLSALRNDISNHRARLIEKRSELKSVEVFVSEYENRLRNEREELLHSPIPGLVWESEVLRGQKVRAGQKLLTIADSRHLFVEAYFGQHFRDVISVGDRAHVLLDDISGALEGTVRSIRVQERDAKPGFAIQSISPHTSMLRVMIEIDSGRVEADSLGRICRVIVSSRDPGFVERSLVWMSFFLKRSTAI